MHEWKSLCIRACGPQGPLGAPGSPGRINHSPDTAVPGQSKLPPCNTLVQPSGHLALIKCPLVSIQISMQNLICTLLAVAKVARKEVLCSKCYHYLNSPGRPEGILQNFAEFNNVRLSRLGCSRLGDPATKYKLAALNKNSWKFVFLNDLVCRVSS
jgi:hypothetical protein